MKKNIQLSITLLLLAQCLSAQVSTFNREVQVQNLIRNVAISIPSNYSPDDPIPLLISLHGFGMSGNSLEAHLKTFAEQEQIIIANIDGAGNRHDDQLNGQEINVVHSALDSMVTWYSIDTSKVLLFGFSYGGRESLYFGSMFPEIFAGIITHSAAIQSTADVNNQLPVPWSSPFQYQNMNQIPICNCMGNNDQNFGPFILEFHQHLGQFSSNDTLIVKDGIGHDIYYTGFFADLQICWQFIEMENQLVTSMKEPLEGEEIIFYPNPSSGIVFTKRKNIKILSLRDMSSKAISYTFQNSILKIQGEPGLHLILYQENGQLKSQKIFLQ